MYKTCNLVMLPSDEKAHFGDIILTPDAKKLLIFQYVNCTEVAQHLYITSNDEIKENSLVLLPDKTIHRMNRSDMIAYLDSESKATKCIIATTQAFMNVPRLSKEFIEAYIKAHNTHNSIKEIDVEYENTVRNRFGEVHIQTINDGEEYIKTTILISSILKINPDNTINIKQSKDSWNRSEVVELCTKAVIYGFEHSDEDNNGNYDDRDNNETLLDMFVENFIKENL